jgi:hypothetical protein
MIAIDDLQAKSYEEAMALLAEHCRKGEALRITTPDLTWIWHTQYPSPTIDSCANVNAVMRRHAFLYNFRALEATLLAAGYSQVTRVPAVPGTLIVEASGSGGVEPDYLAPARDFYLRDVKVV